MLATRDIVAWLHYGEVDTGGRPTRWRAQLAGPMPLAESERPIFAANAARRSERDDWVGQLFDGMLPNVAGGKMGEFNVRFGQPSSLSNRSVNNLPPYLDIDPEGDDGIIARVQETGRAPKIIYTNTSSEYWGGHGALAHGSTDGARDIDPPANVRSWLFCGTQHGPAKLPLSDTNPDSRRKGHSTAELRGLPSAAARRAASSGQLGYP